MTTNVDDYPAGSPERSEWQAIRERNVDYKLAKQRRLDEWFPNHQLDAETLYHEQDIHRRLLVSVTSSGWLLFPDVSEHQGAFDWPWCKSAGIRVGAFKRGEGRTYTDAQAAANDRGVSANMDAGQEYHFAFWSAEYDSNPALWEAQGEFFAAHANLDNAHAIDVEMKCGGVSTAVDRIVRGYYREISARGRPNHPLQVYTNKGLWGLARGVPPDPSSLGPGGLKLWVAGYAPGIYIAARGSLGTQWTAVPAGSDGGLPFLGWGNGEFAVMQFTDHAAVAGQSVDGNAFHGTIEDFRRLLITGEVDDHMSAADVAALQAYLDKQFAALPGATAVAIAKQQLFRATKPDGTPLTFMDVLYGEFGEHPLAAADVQALVNAGADRAAQKVLDNVPTGGTWTKDQLQGAVEDGLREVMSDVRLTAPPADTPTS